VEERDPYLVGELVRIGEIGFQGQAEDQDPVRLDGPVGAPLVERHALVEAVERLVGAEAVVAQLLRRGLVRDDDGNLVERRAERGRNSGDRPVDQVVEPLVLRGVGTPGREAGSSTALDHGVRMLAAMTQPLDPPELDSVLEIALEAAAAPDPDPQAEPEGFMVANHDTRLHFLDWGEPTGEGTPGTTGGNEPGVLLVPGLLQPVWSWAPVARRVCRVRHAVIADLRGQGLSDAPPDGYDLEGLAGDLVAVAEGSGLLPGVPVDSVVAERRVVVAGHGFGAIVAAALARRLGPRCAGLVLVDGGWERLEVTTDLDVDAFLRGLDEPPEVLRSMDAWLADRRGFDPASWDADQERAARDAVVETAAGRVVRTVRPFVVDALVRTMFDYEPAAVMPAVDAPITVLVALGGADAMVRLSELERAAGSRTAAGGSPVRAAMFPTDAHNLMRYRPAEVSSAILGSPSAA
jgi:pimeloyl-ACP methyl ester carboxylesterase